MSSNSIDLTDTFSVIAPRYSGTISVIASSIIIFVIFRSHTKLALIYHRIMFGMSITFIIGSIAIALTTIPMPRNDDSITHQGVRLGNEITCMAQGLAILFGLASMNMYNGSLWIYYCCSLGFFMEEDMIRKRVEPFLHFFPIAGGITVAIFPFFFEGYGVSNRRPFCTMKDGFGSQILRAFQTYLLVIYTFVSVFISLSVIIWRVRLVRRKLIGEANLREASEFRKSVKAMLIQASAYLLSHLLSSLPVLIASRPKILHKTMLIRIQLILLPVSGVINCIIFISFKMYNFMRVNDYYTRCEVFCLLFHAYIDPLILTNLSLVQEDRENERNRIRGILGNEINNFPTGSCEEKSGLENYLDLSEEKNLSGFEIDSSRRSMMMIENSNSVDNNADVQNEAHVEDDLESDLKLGTRDAHL